MLVTRILSPVCNAIIIVCHAPCDYIDPDSQQIRINWLKMVKNDIRKWQKIGIPLILMGDLNGIFNSICNTQTSNNAQLADWWNQVNIKKQFSIPSIDIKFVKKKECKCPFPFFTNP